MHYFLCMCVLIFLLIASTICSAQIKLSDFNDYTHYTVEDGLPSTFISGITEDKHGFLWIATGNGITRYDGNHFTNFKYYQEVSIQYEIGFVESMVFDSSREKLWIGSKAGILYTTLDSVNFRKIDNLIPILKFTTGDKADMFLDKNNMLWIGKGSSTALNLNYTSMICLNPAEKTRIVRYQDVGVFYIMFKFDKKELRLCDF